MCDNCIHKAVCSKYIATGGVKSCEHHKEERKGRWVQSDHDTLFACSICGDLIDVIKTNYCPNCGAKMDGDVNENPYSSI